MEAVAGAQLLFPNSSCMLGHAGENGEALAFDGVAKSANGRVLGRPERSISSAEPLGQFPPEWIAAGNATITKKGKGSSCRRGVDSVIPPIGSDGPPNSRAERSPYQCVRITTGVLLGSSSALSHELGEMPTTASILAPQRVVFLELPHLRSESEHASGTLGEGD